MDGALRLVMASLALLGTTTPGSDGLKDLRVEGPDYIRVGEDLTLTCSYDMERDMLYAVKWYTGAEEFYRYVPKEVPPQKVFSFGRLDVDAASSTDHRVLLRNVSLELTGLYKCVVSAESPFQTLSGVKEVMIVAIGYESPTLSLGTINYAPGDLVRANCTLERTYPLPNFTWLINDRKLKAGTLISILDNSPHSLIGTAVSRITFSLPDSFEPTRLTCRVRMYDVYDEMVTKRIQPNPRRSSLMGPDTQVRPNNSSHSAAFPAAKNSAQLNLHHFHSHYRYFLVYLFVLRIS